MKKLYSIFLFIFISQSIYSQNTFELLINSPSDDNVPAIVVEDNEGNFIISAYKENYDTYYTHLFKISKYGNTLLSKEITKLDTNCLIEYIVNTSDNNYIGIGFTVKPDTSEKLNFWIIKFNTNLDILLDKQYYTNHYSQISILASLIDNNGNIIVTGCSNAKPSDPFSHDIFMYKLSQNGDTLQSKYFEDDGMDLVFDIIEKKDSSGYFVFAIGYNLITNSPGQILEIDTSFNIVSIDSIPRNFFTYYNAEWLTDTTYLLTGKYHYAFSSPQDDDLGILIIDTAINVFYENYFGKADTIDYPGFIGNLDFIDTSNIYYGGTSNLIIGSHFQNLPSWIILNKLDSKLNLKWQKYYGGDAYYGLWNILATQDGGCLLLGTRYDHNTQDEERDIYILKVDENGEFTSVNEPKIKVSEIIIYPNPGYDKLYIRTALKENILLELYNITGKIVLKQEINNYITNVNINFLPSGLYFYRFLNEHKIIESGKWVKQ